MQSFFLPPESPLPFQPREMAFLYEGADLLAACDRVLLDSPPPAHIRISDRPKIETRQLSQLGSFWLISIGNPSKDADQHGPYVCLSARIGRWGLETRQAHGVTLSVTSSGAGLLLKIKDETVLDVKRDGSISGKEWLLHREKKMVDGRPVRAKPTIAPGAVSLYAILELYSKRQRR